LMTELWKQPIMGISKSVESCKKAGNQYWWPFS
jgi:hypothetical protein